MWGAVGLKVGTPVLVALGTAVGTELGPLRLTGFGTDRLAVVAFEAGVSDEGATFDETFDCSIRLLMVLEW